MNKNILSIIRMIADRVEITTIMDEVTKLDFNASKERLHESKLIQLEDGLIRLRNNVTNKKDFNSTEPKIALLHILNNTKHLEHHHIWESYLLDAFSIFILDFDQEDYNDYIEYEQISRLKHYNNTFFTRKEIREELINRTEFYRHKQYVTLTFEVTKQYDGYESADEINDHLFINPKEITDEFALKHYVDMMDNYEDEDEYESCTLIDDPSYKPLTYSLVNGTILEFDGWDITPQNK